MNEAIHEIVQTMVPPEVGNLYRWESEDLSVFKSAQNMTAVELTRFYHPDYYDVSLTVSDYLRASNRFQCRSRPVGAVKQNSEDLQVLKIGSLNFKFKQYER